MSREYDPNQCVGMFAPWHYRSLVYVNNISMSQAYDLNQRVGKFARDISRRDTISMSQAYDPNQRVEKFVRDIMSRVIVRTSAPMPSKDLGAWSPVAPVFTLANRSSSVALNLSVCLYPHAPPVHPSPRLSLSAPCSLVRRRFPFPDSRPSHVSTVWVRWQSRL